MALKTRRVYDDPTPDDGYRILVDRLWPRGETKADVDMDEWGKVLAPSTDLRRAWHHKEIEHDEFEKRYLAEMAEPDAVAAIAGLAKRAVDGDVTLLYASKHPEETQVPILVKLIETAMGKLR